MKQIEEIGFRPWKVNRHEGSDCCLDVSYVWSTKSCGDDNSGVAIDSSSSSSGNMIVPDPVPVPVPVPDPVPVPVPVPVALGKGSDSGINYDKNGRGISDSQSDDNFVIDRKKK